MEINMKGYNLDNFKEKDIYTWEEIISAVQDMECEVHRLQERIDELENDIESNYRPISISEQVGIDDRDFI